MRLSADRWTAHAVACDTYRRPPRSSGDALKTLLLFFDDIALPAFHELSYSRRFPGMPNRARVVERHLGQRLRHRGCPLVRVLVKEFAIVTASRTAFFVSQNRSSIHLREGLNVSYRRILLEVPGLGPWSVDIYYLMALRRPDAWPQVDLALASALQEVKRLEALPTRDEQQTLASGGAPWRPVAARTLWAHYLARHPPPR